MKTLVLAVAMLAAAETTLPQAETILDRYVEVTGGRKAYEEHTSESFTAKLSIPAQGLTGTIVSYAAAPGKLLTITEIAGVGKMESGTDGEVYWERSPARGPRIRKSEDLPQARRMALFNAPIHWRKLFVKAETTGTDMVDGKLCYLVTMTPQPPAKPEESCYDKESGLLARSKVTVKTLAGELAIETAFSNYQKVGGLLMPGLMTQTIAGQKVETSVEEFTFNPELPPNRFDLPDDIAKLAGRKKE